MAIPLENLPAHRPVGSGLGKILVTGGKGGLAAPISRALTGCGEIILTEVSPAVGDESAAYHQADLTDFPRVLGLMQGIDTVVHLVAVAAKSYSVRSLLGPSELEPYQRRGTLGHGISHCPRTDI